LCIDLYNYGKNSNATKVKKGKEEEWRRNKWKSENRSYKKGIAEEGKYLINRRQILCYSRKGNKTL
jgi:hypothetical protein